MSSQRENLSDTELALLAQEGDAAAFEEIYDRHAPGVARSLASYAGPDRDILDDLTQDVFFRVIDGLKSYAPSRPFAHWLYTIALNVGRNHVRRSHGRKVIALDPDEIDEMNGHGARGTSWSEEIIGLRLMRLASRLSDPLREVVFLRIGSDMPYGDIADVLGIPEGTARRRMHEALAVLREKMGLHSHTNKEKKDEQGL